MDNFNYNIGSGLTDINATSVTTDTLVCDDMNSQSGIINLNTSSLSNIQNLTLNNTAYLKTTYLQNSGLYLRTLGDTNHGLIHYATVDGPRLFGYAGGALGTTSTGTVNALSWNSAGNVGISTTSPAYTLDVNGTSAMRNGNANVYWNRNQILFGYNNTNTYQHAINTRHDGGGGNKNSIDFLLWDNNVSSTTLGTKNTMSITASGVGINTSNPARALDVVGDIRGSNLETSNLIKYRGQNVLDTDGKIDFSWIKNAPIQDDGTGVIVIPIPVITNIYTNINPSINTDTGGTGDENYSPGDNAIHVHWKNVQYHPFYCRSGTDEQVAFGSNVFIEKNSKIYGVDSVDLIKTDAGRIRTLDTNLLNPVVFYDFANQEMFLKVINCNSNINASNISSCNITSSNSTFYNVYVQSNINSSNINSSNIYSSNFDTRVLYATQSVLSNATLCNALFTSNATVNYTLISSNINSSNIYASNIETRTFISSNGVFSNLNTNFLTATYTTTDNGIVNQNLTVTNNVYTSNITCCNVKDLSNNYHTFSNMSWKFNDSNIYHGLFEKVIAIGQSNATEKLDILGNIKVSGGGIFANSKFVINSNPANPHCLTINNSNMFRADGTIGNDFLSQLNILAGNLTFTGTAGDIFNPQTQSSNLLTNFNSVIWKPTYHDSNYNLGFSSNVYFNRFSQLCTTEPAWDYSKSNNGMYKTFNAPFVRSNVVINFSNYTATLCNIFSSNATISNNIYTSNISASNITTSNLISLNANLSNLWASNVGINQVNPLYNLDVNGGARIQKDLLVNNNITCGCNLTVASNLGVGTTSPTYRLDVNGDGLIRGTTAWNAIGQQANLFLGDGFNKIAGEFGGGIVLQPYGTTKPFVVQQNTGNVGIGYSNPSYKLDINGTGLRLLGGAGATPTILYLNSTGAGNTTSQLQFVNSGHSITCTDSNSYAGITNVGGGHNIYYSSGGHNFSGTARFDNMQVRSSSTLELGQGVAGKDSAAGRIGYQTYTSGALDIVGAGTTGGNRKVKLWDNVEIPGSLTVGGSTLFKQMFFGSYTIGSSSTDVVTTNFTLALGGATANYIVFPSVQQTTSFNDYFALKWDRVSSSGTNNTFAIHLVRGNGSSWSASVAIHYMVVVL